ncbi:heavy-metal-associated domain-containing protein [Caldisalinibacter kiritimatiensis]|uniref:Heavy-metal binding protein n=1 Tax=Caldisalinibacter kiritimatiensis TaxID=1304284 RepID=R1ASE9_9FIRM|nr:heavy-metal-associated domain-containing protein [Caldisalinibacter kiritimatiensis]EOD00063.1 heavy-metal binding protein [Caldisalinibacter kiritimatiensis]
MKKAIKIEGMSCQHCVMAVKNALQQVKGVKTVDVDSQNSKAVVEVENANDNELKKAVNEAGYDVVDIK